MGNITIQGDLTGDVPGGEVGGASNLTTVGAIPYVSAAGILNQDPTALFWDAANDRLGIGTNTPGTTINATGGAIALEKTSGGFVSSLSFQGNNAALGHYSQTALLFGTQTTASGGGFAEQARLVGSTGNLLIGTTTDSNFKLDVAASGNAGTARFYGGSGVSNSTKVVVQAGAGQSGNLQEWQAANGGVRASVGSVGDFIGSSYDNGGTWEAGSSLNRLSNTYRVQWSSTGSYAGAADLSLSRASAGVLQVGDGGSNANGTVAAGRYEVRLGGRYVVRRGVDDLDVFNIYAFGSASNDVNFQISQATGNILLRSSANNNLATFSNTGTFTFFNQTPTTGATRALIRAGAGQSTTNLTEWQDNGGTILSRVDSVGAILAPEFELTSATLNVGNNLSRYGSGYLLRWSSTSLFNGSADISLSRASAGVLQVGDGAANANGVVSLTRSQHAGVLVAALPAAAAGNAGSIQYVTDANATTIGSTVAGGGANKVMVWSDGAAWKIFAS